MISGIIILGCILKDKYYWMIQTLSALTFKVSRSFKILSAYSLKENIISKILNYNNHIINN
jgi:hypothetical protein